MINHFNNGSGGKLRDGDIVEIHIDTLNLNGHLHFLGTEEYELNPEEGGKVLAEREQNKDIRPSEYLPDDTRLWAELQKVSGGTWRGSVYDVDRIIKVLKAGEKALEHKEYDYSENLPTY
ncbi:hypothetical protein [Halobacillus seohaensis]|uniref:Uncharacterized protein n=1 Tax=Halobacillus seohaensis TaxID=447421 RepID=A0ABW2EME9_9BACI